MDPQEQESRDRQDRLDAIDLTEEDGEQVRKYKEQMRERMMEAGLEVPDSFTEETKTSGARDRGVSGGY